jgi:hypothetical protein
MGLKNMKNSEIKDHLLKAKEAILLTMRKSPDIKEIQKLSKAIDEIDAAYSGLM